MAEGVKWRRVGLKHRMAFGGADSWKKNHRLGEINESASLVNFPQVFDSRHSTDSAVRRYGLRLRMINPEKPFVTMAAARGIQEL